MVKIQNHLKEIGKSPTLNINEISADLEDQGRTVYKFGFGQSPFPVPETVIDELKKYANEKAYLPVEGLYPLREAVANYYINQENILLLIDDHSYDEVYHKSHPIKLRYYFHDKYLL